MCACGALVHQANSSDGVSSVMSVALASEQSASVRQAFLLLPQVARVRHCRVASAWWHALTGLRVALEAIPANTDILASRSADALCVWTTRVGAVWRAHVLVVGFQRRLLFGRPFADFANASDSVSPSEVCRADASPVAERRLLADLRIGAGGRDLRIADVSTTHVGDWVRVEVRRAHALVSSTLGDTDLISASVATIVVVRVAWALLVLGWSFLVSSFRAGNFLDSGSESGVEVLESINVESAFLRAGNLLEFDVEHVIRYSHCVQLDVLETSVVGWSSHVVLTSTISNDDADSADAAGGWSSSSSSAESLISDVLDGSSGSGESSQILDGFDGLVQRAAVLVVG